MSLCNLGKRTNRKSLLKRLVLTTLFQGHRLKSSGKVLKNLILRGLRRLFHKVSPTKRTFSDRSPRIYHRRLLSMTTGWVFPDPDVFFPQAQVTFVPGG